MRRTQLQLPPEAYQALRERAFKEGRSLASVVREAVHAYLKLPDRKARPRTLRDFTFIGSGRSKRGAKDHVSERHDEALAEDFLA